MADLLPWKFRTLMSMAALAQYLEKPSGEAARKWVHRKKVPFTYCGCELRVDKRDVDRVLAECTRARKAS